jgi:hypothetical protein
MTPIEGRVPGIATRRRQITRRRRNERLRGTFRVNEYGDEEKGEEEQNAFRN